MTGKKLVKNLAFYLSSYPAINIPVYAFDRHLERDLPSITIGYENEQNSFSGFNGHFTVSGFINVNYQGYDDLENEDADIMAEKVIDAITSETPLLSTLNKPTLGTDTRPASGFGINALLIRGVTRDKQEHSDQITINFDAFCTAKDFS